MSIAKLGKKCKPRSEETKKKISEATKGKKKNLHKSDNDNNIILFQKVQNGYK